MDDDATSMRGDGRGLPSGVVTFLLSDVVGSTRLWDRAPSAMSAALLRHDELVGSAVAAHNGVLLKSKGEGDSTFSVFARATDAAAAALAAQQAIASEAWHVDTPITVRMSLYSGEVVQRNGDYFGTVVNRAARLRALSGPLQVLVGQSTAELIIDHLPDGVGLVRLGLRQLKDLSRPEVIYALRGPGLSNEAGPMEVAVAPPPRSLPSLEIPLPPQLSHGDRTPFSGRAEESRTVEDVIAQVRGDGAHRVVLLGGEPGIGKTRLAAECARRAQSQGFVVLSGRAMDGGIAQPFQPFAEALTHLLRHLPLDLVDDHVRVHGGELALIAPVLRHRVPDVPSPRAATGDAERHLLVSAISGLLHDMSIRRPLMLILDDLQWADAATLQLVRHLVQSDITNLLMVITYRNTEVDGASGFGQLLADLWREQGIHRIDLGGLSLAEVVDFVANGAVPSPGGPTGDLAAVLRRETGGNPFLLGELFRHLVESGRVRRRAEGGWDLTTSIADAGLPNSVHDVVHRRVERVGGDAIETLRVAAVMGLEFDLSVLAALLRRDEDDVIDTLERSEAASLIHASSVSGTYVFAHALIARTLLDELSAVRLQRLHVRVAEQLERDPSVPAAQLARHWLAADRDRSAAVQWAEKAGDEALEMVAPADAAQWYLAALTALDPAPGATGVPRTSDTADRLRTRRVSLLIKLGTAQRQAGNPAFRATLLDSAQIAQDAGDAALLVQAALANNRGLESVTGAVDDERITVLEAALRAVGGDDHRDRAALLATLASELSFHPDVDRRVAVADEALAMARRLDDPETLLSVLGQRFYAVLTPDRLLSCITDAEKHLSLAQRLDRPVALVFAGVHLAEGHLMTADAAGYHRALDIAVAAVERSGQPFLRQLVLNKQSQRALIAGHLDEAERFATDAFTIGRRLGLTEALAVYSAQVARIRQLQGRSDEVIAVFERLADRPGSHVSLRPILCLYYCRAGRHEDARRIFDAQDVIDFASLPRDRYSMAALATYAEVCTTLRQPEPAAVLLGILRPYADQVPFSGSTFMGSAAHHCGRLAALVGDAAAESLFATAHDVHARLDAPMWLAQSDYDWAEWLLGRDAPGDRMRAYELVASHHRLATERGWTPLVDEAARLLELSTSSPGRSTATGVPCADG